VSVSPGTASAGPSAEDLTTVPGDKPGERVPTGKLGQALKDRTPPKFGPGGKCQVGGKLAASACRSLF
jgi:hypothetical protein